MCMCVMVCMCVMSMCVMGEHVCVKLHDCCYFAVYQVTRVRQIFATATGLESTCLVTACGLGEF